MSTPHAKKPAPKTKVLAVPVDDLLPHPKNANVTPTEVLKKIERNIKRTGNYPPLVVRPLDKTKFQILDGHHRLQVLKQLGLATVDVVVWDISDQEADIAIATLNTLHGTDDKKKRQALLRGLAETIPLSDLADIVPEDAAMLKALTDDVVAAPTGGNAGEEPIAFEVLEFRVTANGGIVIREALSRIKAIVMKDGAEACADGTALEYLCAEHIAGH